MPISRRSDCVPLPIVVCPVVAVVMPRQHSPHSAHIFLPKYPASQQLGQTNIGSGMESDLLMMGNKMPETC